jgi:hypothetical protein
MGCSSGRVVVGLAALLLVLPGLSCSRSGHRRPVFPVRGQVLLEGKPLSSVLVVFHPAGAWGAEESRPYARTDRAGRFAVSTYGTEDGAPAGEYKVAIVELRGRGEEDEAPADEGGPRKARSSPPPARYADPETSGLRVRVHEGPNELEPFQLKAGRREPARPKAPPVDD